MWRILTGLLAMALCAVGPAAAQNRGEKTYVIEGIYVDEAGRAEIIDASDRLTKGLEALRDRDFRTAQKLCRSALDTFHKMDLPDRGVFASQYDLITLCLGESYYFLGSKLDGCINLRSIGFQTMHLANAREACAEFVPPEVGVDNAITDRHDAYARSLKAFNNDYMAMMAMPQGSKRSAAAAALEPHCAVLDGYGKEFAAAAAAAKYCLGVVRAERGDIRGACQAWKEGYAHAQNALSDNRQYAASGEQKSNARNLLDNLSNFTQFCADEGYPW